MGVFSLNAAMAADFQGQKLLASLNQEQAQTEDIKAQSQMRQMEAMAMKKKQEGQQQVADWMKADAQSQVAPLDDAVDLSQKYDQASKKMAADGNFTGMEIMAGLAKKETERSKQVRVELEAQQQGAREEVAKAATDYAVNPTPEVVKTLTQAAMKAGQNPLEIPPPGTPAFGAWAKTQQTAAMSGKERLAFFEKQKEFDQTLQEKKENHEAMQEDRQARREQTAQFQNASLALRSEALSLHKILATSAAASRGDAKETAKTNAQFKQAEQLNTKLQREAEPFLKDRLIVTEAKGLLQVNSSVSDQQLHQVLPSLLGQLKGRATNVYYKDNANFGNIAEKLEGVLSRGATGRYSEAQRKQIYELLDGMEKKVLDPSIVNLEKDQKKHATKYGIDPELIEVQGSFERKAPSAAPDPAKAAATVPGVSPDGTTASNPKTGEKMIKRNGKWEKM